MPSAWLSIDTTRSRRFEHLVVGAIKSCGPFSASTAAAWLIDDVCVDDCDCTTVIALISSTGPAVSDAPAGHGIDLGVTVQGDRTVEQARLDSPAREFEIVVNHMFVHVVGHDPDMFVPYQHVGQPFISSLV